MMKAIVLGGTSGMGRAIARLLASRGDSVFLMGIGSQDLERSAADFEKSATPSGPTSVTRYAISEKPDGFAAALDAADAFLGSFDTVVVTAGDVCDPRGARGRHRVCSAFGHRELRQYGRLLRARSKATARPRRGEAHGVLVGRGRPRSQAGGHLRFEQRWSFHLTSKPSITNGTQQGSRSPASSRDS